METTSVSLRSCGKFDKKNVRGRVGAFQDHAGLHVAKQKPHSCRFYHLVEIAETQNAAGGTS